MGGGGDKPEESQYSKELAEIASKEWNKYQESYVPVENQYMASVEKMGTEQAREDVAGDVATSYAKSFGEAGQEQERQLAAAGVDPSSGKARGARGDLSEAQAKTTADATSKAQSDVTRAYTGNLANVVAMGKGQEAQAVGGLQDISRAANLEASQDAVRKASEASIPAAVAGGAAAYAANNPDKMKNLYENTFSPSDMSLGAANIDPSTRTA